MAIESFTNIPAGIVTSGGTTAPAAGTVETWTVTVAAAAFPVASASPTPPVQFHVCDPAQNSEQILVTVAPGGIGAGQTWTVTRGVEGTTPVPHTTQFVVYQVASAGALGMFPQWFNVRSIQYGAKGNGTADDTAAIQAAVTAAIGTGVGGIVYLPAGIYKTTSTITAVLPNNVTVMILGDGYQATIINYAGSGDCLRMYDATSWTTGNNIAWRSGVQHLAIDGTSATGTATGLHFGDIGVAKIDIYVRNFTAGIAPSYTGTGSIGINFDNTVTWMEESDVRATVENCTQHVVLQATTGFGSFGYGNFDFTIFQGVNTQDGVAIMYGGNIYHGSLRVRGNFLAGAAATSAGVVRVAYLNTSGGPTNGDGSVLALTHVDIQVECATGTHAPSTLVTDSHSLVSGLYGIMSFAWGAGSFAAASLGGTFTFMGYIDGDTTLGITGYNTNGNHKVTGTLTTTNQTLDDGSGNATISGNMTVDGSLALEGGIGYVFNTQTSTGNITTGESTVALNGSSITATMPSASTAFWRAYFIKNINSTAAILAAAGGQTIDGAASITLAQNQGVVLQSDGSNWQIIAADGFTSSPVTLPAGTATAAPLNFTSGTLETTAAAGAEEYDGTCFYVTAAASSRQVIDAEQFVALTTTYTLANNTSAQQLFNATANGALTVQGATSYWFEAEFDITGLSSSLHSVQFGFALGASATVTSIKYVATSNLGAAGTFAAWQSAIVTSASATTLHAGTTTNTTFQARLRGIIRMNHSGTITPQVTQASASAAAVVGANSWFRIWPVGSGTVASVGDWS